MNMNKFCLILLMLFPCTVFANSKTISCTPVDVLDNGAEECKDNPRYIRAGEDCLSKLEGLIAKAAGISAKDLKEKAISDLRKKRKKSADNFLLAGPQRENLIAAAKYAKEKIDSYRNNIFFPEDWDAPEELIGNPITFLDAQECYSDARDSLRRAARLTEYYLRSIEQK